MLILNQYWWIIAVSCFTFFNSTAWRPPIPLPCSENQNDSGYIKILRDFIFLGPTKRITIPMPYYLMVRLSSPPPRWNWLQVLPVELPPPGQQVSPPPLYLGLPCCSKKQGCLCCCYYSLYCSWLLCWCHTQTTCLTCGLVYCGLKFKNVEESHTVKRSILQHTRFQISHLCCGQVFQTSGKLAR